MGAPPAMLPPRISPGGPCLLGSALPPLGSLPDPAAPPASRTLFTDCCLPLGTSGRRMGPPWAPRTTPASVLTKTAPCTSRRRGRGTSARTPVGCCPPEAMTLAVPTCVSGEGTPPQQRGYRQQWEASVGRCPGPRVTWVCSPLGTHPSLLQGLPPSSVKPSVKIRGVWV